MSQLVTREMLEEIMLSFTIDIYSEEDIEFINNVYRDYMNKKYIGDLGIGDWGLGIGPNPQSPIPIFIISYILKIILTQ